MKQPEKNATLIKISEWSRPFLFQWKTQQLCYVGVCRCCFYFCCCCCCIWGRKMYSVNETHHHFQRLRFLSSCCDCFCMCLLSGLWVCPWAAAVHLLRYIRGCIMLFSSPSFFWCSFLAYLNKTKYEKKWNGAVLCGFIFVDIFKRKNSSKPTRQTYFRMVHFVPIQTFSFCVNRKFDDRRKCVLLVESIMFLWKNGVSLNMALFTVQT